MSQGLRWDMETWRRSLRSVKLKQQTGSKAAVKPQGSVLFTHVIRVLRVLISAELTSFVQETSFDVLHVCFVLLRPDVWRDFSGRGCNQQPPSTESACMTAASCTPWANVARAPRARAQSVLTPDAELRPKDQ